MAYKTGSRSIRLNVSDANHDNVLDALLDGNTSLVVPINKTSVNLIDYTLQEIIPLGGTLLIAIVSPKEK